MRIRIRNEDISLRARARSKEGAKLLAELEAHLGGDKPKRLRAPKTAQGGKKPSETTP